MKKQTLTGFFCLVLWVPSVWAQEEAAAPETSSKTNSQDRLNHINAIGVVKAISQFFIYGVLTAGAVAVDDSCIKKVHYEYNNIWSGRKLVMVKQGVISTGMSGALNAGMPAALTSIMFEWAGRGYMTRGYAASALLSYGTTAGLTASCIKLLTQRMKGLHVLPAAATLLAGRPLHHWLSPRLEKLLGETGGPPTAARFTRRGQRRS